jgi:hypothetical protein
MGSFLDTPIVEKNSDVGEVSSTPPPALCCHGASSVDFVLLSEDKKF